MYANLGEREGEKMSSETKMWKTNNSNNNNELKKGKCVVLRQQNGKVNVK